jgi:hypothetical protein
MVSLEYHIIATAIIEEQKIVAGHSKEEDFPPPM